MTRDKGQLTADQFNAQNRAEALKEQMLRYEALQEEMTRRNVTSIRAENREEEQYEGVPENQMWQTIQNMQRRIDQLQNRFFDKGKSSGLVTQGGSPILAYQPPKGANSNLA